MAGAPAPPSGSGYVIPTTGPVTPEEIYYLLIAKGASTAQAIGIMANMKAESSLDPESGGIDNNGKWAGGLISWNSGSYPNAHSLVTGDPQKDVRAQINYLFSNTNGLQAGLQGATAQDVAGNFAAHVEVCEGCQPGSTFSNGWSTRVGYAAGLLAAATSGNWQAVTSSSVGSGGASSGSSSGSGSGCLIQFPGIAGIGSACLLSKSQARALIGGLTLAPATGFLIVGAVVLAAFAFRRSGAGGAVGGAAEAVGGAVALLPGGVTTAAGGAIAAAGSAEKRAARARTQQQGQQRAARQSRAREAREGRDYDRVMARNRDSAAGPAVRGRELDPAPF